MVRTTLPLLPSPVGLVLTPKTNPTWASALGRWQPAKLSHFLSREIRGGIRGGIRDELRWTRKTGQARSPCGLSWSLLTDSLYQDLPAESSQYSTLWPTRLDKIKNLHAAAQVGSVGGLRSYPLTAGTRHSRWQEGPAAFAPQAWRAQLPTERSAREKALSSLLTAL